jgi:hypothetical protein
MVPERHHGIHTHDREAPQDQLVHLDARNGAAHEPDDHNAPLEGNEAPGRFEQVSADGVDDDIGTSPVGELLDDPADVVGSGVDADVGTGILAPLGPLGSEVDADDARPRRPGQVDGRAPDTTSTAEDDDDFARSQPGPSMQGEMSGDVVRRQGDGGDHRQLLGQRFAVELADDRLLGEGTAPRDGGRHDPSPDGGARAGAGGPHAADELTPGRRRQWQRDLVLASHEQEVREHHPGNLDVHQEIPRSRLGRRHGLHGQDIAGIAGPV